MCEDDLAFPFDAAPAGVVLAQASRVNETFAPSLVSDGRALPLRRWAQQWSCARVASVTELVERWDRYRLLFGIGEQLAYLSRHTRLRPGDLLCTGSPAGFGIHHNRFLRPGDVIRASITGLGEQVKHCVEQTRPTAADPRRTPQMEPTP